MNPRTSFHIRKAWQEAAAHLGFSVIAPFAIDGKNGHAKYLGVVPKFGSAKGTVLIFESSAGSSKEKKIADAAGYGWSVMNTGDYHEFKSSYFEAVLRDWEWFGTAKDMPAFLKKRPNQPPEPTPTTVTPPAGQEARQP